MGTADPDRIASYGVMMSVSCEEFGAVRCLTLDSGKMNLLGLESVRQLRKEIDRAGEDGAIEVLVLFAKGRVFSAGLDMNEIARGGKPAQELLVEMGELLVGIYSSRLRIVTACAGHTVAAGAMLLLVADRRLGAEGDYRVGFSELSQGITLPELPIVLARDRLDPRRLQDSTMLGRTWTPSEALEVGFLDRVVSEQELRTAARLEAETLATLDGPAYAKSITAVRGASLAKMRALLEHERRTLSEL